MGSMALVPVLPVLKVTHRIQGKATVWHATDTSLVIVLSQKTYHQHHHHSNNVNTCRKNAERNLIGNTTCIEPTLQQKSHSHHYSSD